MARVNMEGRRPKGRRSQDKVEQLGMKVTKAGWMMESRSAIREAADEDLIPSWMCRIVRFGACKTMSLVYPLRHLSVKKDMVQPKAFF
ncbi:hypothetical protein PoB_007048300 [Plakobranchus ocellatus]|uniref:Uncharacterized protein n=1 Tax=Plakobranchus ocellatus TaxID=259542 RepID=A0AAV4DID4_9GAST|nr:hypothetical protein PoB_007048300 [Plakobranchus ocellatus]